MGATTTMNNNNMASVLAVLLCAASTTFTYGLDDGSIPTDQFPFHVQLDPNFKLHWIYNSSHIMFECEVKTNGYLALGISPNGKMYPADVAVAWVNNGHPHLLDGHTIGHTDPVLDKHNDLHLLYANETGDTTTVRWWRRLETCDGEDRSILEGTTRVIYSYHQSDPTTHHPPVLDYHGPTQRGSRSLLLLDPPSSETPDTPLPHTIKTFEFLAGNYTVPSTDTTYHCTTFTLPDLGSKHHMIRYEPIITPGHEKLVHHMLIYFCSHDVDVAMAGKDYVCYTERPPQLHNCYSIFIAWAIGGEAFDFPNHVGYPLGTAAYPGFFIVETHYDNPGRRSDFVDNSGFKLTLTSDLRANDAGILEVGVSVNDHQVVPPFNEEFLSTGYCPADCMNEGLGQDMHVFANMLHSHLLGSKIRTRVIRNGQERIQLAQDNNYDFNYQEARKLPKELTLTKGDSLIVECVYNSKERTAATFGGLTTQEEMCLSFVMYYPRSPLTVCRSVPLYHLPAGQRHTYSWANSFDWTKQSERDNFQNLTNTVDVKLQCMGSTHFSSDRKSYHQADLQPAQRYEAPSACP